MTREQSEPAHFSEFSDVDLEKLYLARNGRLLLKVDFPKRLEDKVSILLKHRPEVLDQRLLEEPRSVLLVEGRVED